MSQELRPRVLLADDHAGILAALQRVLNPSCEVVGCATSGVALLEAATRLRPDVIVMDIAMPNVNGLEACREIKHAIPQTKVVVLTATNDPDVKQHALSLGASAFVLKHLMASDLLPAIKKALVGDRCCSRP